jgi:hypothetical protein
MLPTRPIPQARTGRPHWVEKNQKKLRAVQAIIAALEQQRVHGLPKTQREYGPGDQARLGTSGAAGYDRFDPGDPYFNTPEPIRRALAEVVNAGVVHYASMRWKRLFLACSSPEFRPDMVTPPELGTACGWIQRTLRRAYQTPPSGSPRWLPWRTPTNGIVKCSTSIAVGRMVLSTRFIRTALHRCCRHEGPSMRSRVIPVE